MPARHDSHDGCVTSLQEWSDECAFFGQKWFCPEQQRVVAGTLFITICCQDRCAHCERTRRLVASCPHPAICCQRFLFPPETKTGEAERCPGLPVLRLFGDEHLGFALRCLHC